MPWVPNIASALHSNAALACLESACIAEVCSTNANHFVASLAAGNNDVTVRARSSIFAKPSHEIIVLPGKAFQITQMVCVHMILMALKHLGTQQFFEILIPQLVFAAWLRTSDLQPLLIDCSFCPSTGTRPTESMTACMIVPMLVPARSGTPKIALHTRPIV